MDRAVFRDGQYTDVDLLQRRRRMLHDSPSHAIPIRRYDDYTIAWFTALFIELAAAKAILDELHDNLPRRSNDNNIYTLGNIKQHNVVIVSLPIEKYGLINAAAVMTDLTRTFPSIRAGFVVGIGAGAPTEADVRLGDVVVGTRVMQSDLGKVVGEGEFQRTATPRYPSQLLGAAVTDLRSRDYLQQIQIESILNKTLQKYPQFSRPLTEDRLFQPGYEHVGLIGDCSACDLSKSVQRTLRPADDVKIHHGAIASGNQVIKNGKFRDKLAQELKVKCFEMETSGIMDVLACLPIRGICDYADSHKNKEWQPYAAVTAAACARELIEVLPVSEAQPRATSDPPDQNASRDRHQRFLDALRFDSIDVRMADVKAQHSKTCEWFLDHPSYKSWLDPGQFKDHYGFLWIRGKPGAGKSTILKFAYLETKKHDRSGQVMTTSFFFNARGQYLDKSILGMYRSLLLKLLETYTDLQAILDDRELLPRGIKDCPSVQILKNLLRKAFYSLGTRSFTCFIDALDECDEQQIMDMVQYFEELAEHCTEEGILVRICFSSRHYPYIDIRFGKRLTLEKQLGHDKDLERYVKSRLRITDSSLLEDLKAEILEKASGVFLWVVLVVQILNDAYRRALPVEIRTHLSKLPNDLSALFKNILQRDGENKETLLLSLTWILFAKRPLRPEEFFHALSSGLSLNERDSSKIRFPDARSLSSSHFKRNVINSSKGLAEVTRSRPESVQFIHESVKDFLVKDNGLRELWPELEFDFERPSHDILKQCCYSYMNHHSTRQALERLPEDEFKAQTEIGQRFPFLAYAIRNVCFHADAAAPAIPQEQFLSSFPFPYWSKLLNFFAKSHDRHSDNASLLYILSKDGLSELIRIVVRRDRQIHIFGETYGYPFFAALASGKKDAVAALLDCPSTFSERLELDDRTSYDWQEYEMFTPLSWAAGSGRAGIAELLLKMNAPINDMDEGGLTALFRSSESGHEAVVKLLLQHGADPNAANMGPSPLSIAVRRKSWAVAELLTKNGADTNVYDETGETPLLRAATGGHAAVVMRLLRHGADPNRCSHFGWSPLLKSSMNGHEAVARLLLESGAEIDAADKSGRSPLWWASCSRHEATAMLLLEKGADFNGGDDSPWPPIVAASGTGLLRVVKRLLENGADPNACDPDECWALLKAAENGFTAAVELLLQNGADVNKCDINGRGPLLRASEKGFTAVVELLLQNGADPNRCDKDGHGPLLQASEHGFTAVVKALLETGADSSVKDLLLRAGKNGHDAVIRLLLTKGHLNIDSSNGQAILADAAFYGHKAVVRLMLDSGKVDVNTSYKGYTPLQWAIFSRHETIVQLLLAAGADPDAKGENALKHGTRQDYLKRLLRGNN